MAPNSALRSSSLDLHLTGSKGTRQAELGSDAVDAVGGVEVLNECDLVAGGAALARGDGG